MECYRKRTIRSLLNDNVQKTIIQALWEVVELLGLKQWINNPLSRFSESCAPLESLWMLLLMKFEPKSYHLTVISLLKSKVKRTKIGKEEQNQTISAITTYFGVLNHRVTSRKSFSPLSISNQT